MTFQWPLAFLLLTAVPLVLGLYRWKMGRRRKQAVRYSSVALLRSVVPKRSAWKRHAPMAMLLSSLAVLGVASARPQMVRDISTARTSVILALDVSRSMCATDVDPNRLGAAQAAARDFVKGQPKGTRMGLVAFSGSAQVVVAPTTDRKALTEAIDALTTGRGTAIGAAMLKSLDAIAEVNDKVAPVGNVASSSTSGRANGTTGTNGAAPTTTPRAAPAPGGQGYVSDIVVLLTDGANTSGVQPIDAADYAVERRVRVYTIGFGTANPAQLSCSAAQLGLEGAGGGFGGGGFGGGGFGGGFGGGRSPLVANEEVLTTVAEETGAKYYKAEDATQLRKVFADLPKDVTTQKEKREMSQWFAALGALLAGAAIVASIKWSPYP
ncbi:MAG: VWA domain-containing protein [Acidimicrobiia bacterium]